MPTAFGMAYYGNYTYGSGLYGINTPPTITAYVPASDVLNYEPPYTETFNVTYVDYDGDTATLYWYYDGNYNKTGGNYSHNFDTTGSFTVTANVTDWLNQTKQTWAITIESIGGNLTDILLVPKVAMEGDTVTVSARLLALSKNQTNVSITLHAPDTFVFLDETAESREVGNVYTDNYTTVNWVLYTSTIGQYYFNTSYSSTNVSAKQGNSTRLVVTSEDLMGTGIIIFIPLFITLVLLAISWMLNTEKHWPLKLFLMLVSLVFIFQAYQYSALVVSEFYGTNSIINAIGDSTWIFGLIVVAIYSVFLISFIRDIFEMFDEKKRKTGDYSQ